MTNVVFANLEERVSIWGTKLNVESITEPKNVFFRTGVNIFYFGNIISNYICIV